MLTLTSWVGKIGTTGMRPRGRALMMNGLETLTIFYKVRVIDTIKKLSGLPTTMAELSGMILERC